VSSTSKCGTYYLNELPYQPIGECVLSLGCVVLLECVVLLHTGADGICTAEG